MWLILILLLIYSNIYTAEKEGIKTSQDYNFDVSTVVGVMQELCHGYFGLDAEDHPYPEEPMLIAAIEGLMPKTFEILLDIPGQVNKKDSDGFPPLHHAMIRLYSGTYTKKTLKIKQNQNKEAQNFVAAGIEQYKKIIQMIIEYPEFDPQQYSEEGIAEKKVERTYPLDWAATRNCLEFVPLLLQKKSTSYSSTFFKKIAPFVHAIDTASYTILKKQPKFLDIAVLHCMDREVVKIGTGKAPLASPSLKILMQDYKPTPEQLTQLINYAEKKNFYSDKLFLESFRKN